MNDLALFGRLCLGGASIPQPMLFRFERIGFGAPYAARVQFVSQPQYRRVI